MYFNINRNDRKCKLCNQNTVESKYHFLLCCQAYIEIRRTFKKNTDWSKLFILRNITDRQNAVVNKSVARLDFRDETLSNIIEDT